MMKRRATLLGMAALVLASAEPVVAQQSPGYTVSFSGEMRVLGIVSDNLSDFADSGTPGPLSGIATRAVPNKDSDAYYFQRWRLRTTVESADKHARAVWNLEVGDLFWGAFGGASGAEFGGTTTRVGNSTGAELGADGVNVETKNAFLQFDIPFIPNANLLVGLHNIRFLDTPAGGFLDDDAAGIQFNWRLDPVDVQLYTIKASENGRTNADDNDLYAARLGVTLSPDTRVTLEGMVENEQCFARRAAPAGSPAGTVGSCVSADFGDTFWIGTTAGTKIGDVRLDGAFVYGQRRLFSAPLQTTIDESGWGAQLVAQVPIGFVRTYVLGRYSTGDENRIAGGGCHTLPTTHPLCNPISGPPSLAPGKDFSTRSFSTNLTRNSDKLPVIIAGTSWFTVPFVAEFLFGLPTLGAPGFGGSTHYGDPTGTWTVGGSALVPLSAQFILGGGIGYVEASSGTGVYGDHAAEFDAGFLYTMNANFSVQGIAGYVVPDSGDEGWGMTLRTRFVF